MNKTKSFSVLIPDAENPAFVKHVIYALSHEKNVEIHLLSQQSWFSMRFSSYIKSCTIQKTNQYNEEWVEVIYNLVQKKKIDIVLPVGISARRLLSKYKNHPISKYFLLPDYENFELANDKGRLADHLHKEGLPHPVTLHKKEYQLLSFDEISKLEFPILIKPVSGRGGIGIELFPSKQEFSDRLINLPIKDDYVIQQYIQDTISYGCGILCKEGEILAHSIFKFGHRYGNEFTYSTEQLFIENQKILDITRQLMSSLHWSGVANIDFLYDQKKNKYYILEINPRYWSTLSMSVMAGINFPHLEILTTLSLPLPKNNYKPQRFYMVKYALKMFLYSLRSGKTDFSYLKKTDLLDMIKDPLPILFEQAYGLYLKLKRE